MHIVATAWSWSPSAIEIAAERAIRETEPMARVIYLEPDLRRTRS